MRTIGLLLSLVLLTAINLAGQDEILHCSDYNSLYGGTEFPTPLSNDDFHFNGDHSASWTVTQFCLYRQSGSKLPDGQWPCVVRSDGDISLEDKIDSGSWQNQSQGYQHIINALSNYINGAEGSESDSQGAMAIAVNGCYSSDTGCGLIPITWNGLQPDDGLNEGQDGYVICEAYALTDELHCPYNTSDYYSPIVIDLDGKNFDNAFTSVEDGVVWDFTGRGNLQHLAWTNPNRKIGFLVLDRNHNGRIDNAKEMFGNLTYQPMNKQEVELSRQLAAAHQPWRPNGFLALEFFDRKKNGGNENGKIDTGDAVFAELRVWIDTAHDADSRHGELYSLSDLGITSISLSYSESRRTDQYGNTLRYEGTIQMEKVGATIPNIYDVYFQSAAQ